jgi:hypothetical protein
MTRDDHRRRAHDRLILRYNRAALKAPDQQRTTPLRHPI